MATYRVGLIGCGGRQNAHVGAFRDNDACEIVAVADLLEEARTEFAQKHNIPKTYEFVGEMVQDAGVDIVTIVTRPKWMYQPVMDAVQAGVKGILQEKPFQVNIEQSREVLEAAQTAGIPMLVNHQYRFFELADRMRDIVLSGDLGEVEFFRSISAIKLHGQGTHMIDFVRFLYDDRPFSWCLGNFAGKETFDAKQIGPDYDAGVIAFDNDVPLYVEAGRGSSRSPYPDNRLNLYADVVCTKGRIWFGLSHGLRIWWPNGKYEEIEGAWPAMGEPAQFRLVESLIDAIENGTESRCDATKALATSEALCGLLESGLTNQRVTFPLDIAPDLMERVQKRLGA
ncbi:MAG: Gfo/Idh/MocA family oxidoreductase [bacterium]|nr:Gfo/Idh/MocA family oxidoreductase [bacterium]